MIKTDLIYILYILKLKLQLKSVKAALIFQESLRNNLIELLEASRINIDFYLNTNLDTIYTFTNSTQKASIKYPIVKIYFQGKEINFRAIKLYIDRYIHINNKVVSLTRQQETLKSQIIPLKLYTKIITKLNYKISEKMIEENYQFTPFKSFGTLGIIKNRSKRKTVNWGESHKKRDEILAKGGIPYIKKDALKDPNYKGEEWLCYNPEIDFFLHWFKNGHVVRYVLRLKYYIYKPARGINSIVSRLADKKKNREEAFKLYTNTLKNYEGI